LRKKTARAKAAGSGPASAAFSKNRFTVFSAACFGEESSPRTLVPKNSQKSLSEMAGTSQFFTNRFRKLAFVNYSGVTGGRAASPQFNRQRSAAR